MSDLQKNIEYLWENRDQLTPSSPHSEKNYIEEVIEKVNLGILRSAEKVDGKWHVNEWVKKAILLSFRTRSNSILNGGEFQWYDKVPSKFANYSIADFESAQIRAVPGSVVRNGAYIGKNVVLMPSFVNIGAYVGDRTMVDTWATIGACAQIGSNCHISGGAGIGGVLEPLQANPVIIEDDVFIGARSEIAEGVIVGQGSVISMGVFIGASTKIVNRETGEILKNGYVPPYSVVVPGSLPGKEGGPSLYCAVIVKQVDENTRKKTSINDLLRGV